jgi:Spy/CpxP family protein refolding chaperone
MMERLKNRLNLTEPQQKLWSEAQGKRREAAQAMRAQRESDRKALSAQLASGPLDLRAQLASREAARAQLPPLTLSFMSQSRRLSNARLKQELRLRLRYPGPESGLLSSGPPPSEGADN